MSNAVPYRQVWLATANGVALTATQVTITGSGFGTVQGSGQVWLGTANGAVLSWNDTQVVAEVASGSTSGNAQILQNGVLSNAVPFTIDSLQITDVTPNSGGPGISVTITGSGFGANQGSGLVWLGSTTGDVVSWNNNQVVAAVSTNSVTGVVRIEQNGIWSNAVTFTVPTGDKGSLTLTPNFLNMMVGETHAIQALDANQQPVTGLTWTSSDTNLLTLSTDDPPLITAIAPGHVTILAGGASADVTISDTSFAPGTVLWSNPGDGSGVYKIVPAVPSSQGVADVFAFNASGTVQAIKSDGTTAWTSSSNNASNLIPDFQGGLVLGNQGQFGVSPPSIQKLDGVTGQPYPAYTSGQNDSLSTPLVHTDGTVFTVHSSCNGVSNLFYENCRSSVVGIDPKTGNEKFRVPMDQSQNTGSCSGNNCGSPANWTYLTPSGGPLIIAGDGNAYVVYSYTVSTSISTENATCVPDPNFPGPYHPYPCLSATWDGSGASNAKKHLVVLRVGSDGSSLKMEVKKWEETSEYYYDLTSNDGIHYYGPSQSASSGDIPGLLPSPPITNGDKGILFTWEEDHNGVAPLFGLGTTSGSKVTSTTTAVPGQTTAIAPVLQAQDQSFVGLVGTGPSPGNVTQYNMIAFYGDGKPKWTVPNDYPQIATADGGVIGTSGTTYDGNGKANGKTTNATQSWRDNTYQLGSVDGTLSIPVAQATPPYWSSEAANRSSNSASPLCRDERDALATEYGQHDVRDSYFGAFPLIPKKNWPKFTPSCFLFSDAQVHSQYFTFSELNRPGRNQNPEIPGFALIRTPLVARANSGYGLDLWRQLFEGPRNINSCYRDPNQNPQHNNNSRHMFGDAVDLRNESGSEDEWQLMVEAAGGVVKGTQSVAVMHNGASADYIEPEVLPTNPDGSQPTGCGLACTHADWRYHLHGDYALTLQTSPF